MIFRFSLLSSSSRVGFKRSRILRHTGLEYCSREAMGRQAGWLAGIDLQLILCKLVTSSNTASSWLTKLRKKKTQNESDKYVITRSGGGGGGGWALHSTYILQTRVIDGKYHHPFKAGEGHVPSCEKKKPACLEDVFMPACMS